MHSLLIVIARTTLLLSCLVSFSSTAEQVYRWVDKAGHVTFTGSPTPPSPDHRLEETQSYIPPSIESQEQGLRRMEELRAYNREHPLPSVLKDKNQSTSSQTGCGEAMRHYEIESGSMKSTHASVRAAEAQMRAKCNRSERKPRSKNITREVVRIR